MNIIDVNAAWGDWPIQYLGAASLEALDSDYASLAISEVWLSASGAILAPEPDRADHALFSKVSAFSRFRPVKTVNPLLGNWRASLHSFCAEYAVAAVKLVPNYHAYPLLSPEVHALCEVLERLGLPLLIQMRVNDERNQPICLEVNGVDPQEIAALSREHPALTLIALSAYSSELAALSKGSANLLADLSFLDGIRTLERAASILPASRIVFGSAAPWMIIHPAILKLEHALTLSPEESAAIASGNILARNPHRYA